MAEVDRHLGELQSDVNNLKERFEKLEEKVNDIHVVITKAKGGWLLLIIVGGALTWAIQTFLPVLKKVSF